MQQHSSSKSNSCEKSKVSQSKLSNINTHNNNANNTNNNTNTNNNSNKKNQKQIKNIMSTAQPDNCIFCQKCTKPNSFSFMINRALYSKFSASQNYYFTKDINDIIGGAQTSAVIKYKDYQTYDEDEEFFKRFYQFHEYPNKIKMLTEYYKFHRDISRLFMQPTSNILNKFHDKKRRIEYVRITRMLKDEDHQGDNKNGNPIPTVDQNYKPLLMKDRILAGLEESLQRISMSLHRQQQQQAQQQLKNQQKGSSNNILKNKVHEIANTSQNQNVTGISNTIQDLNGKLGDIISNSKQFGDTYNFDTEERTESLGNLSNFLNYMKKFNQSPLQQQLFSNENQVIQLEANQISQNINFKKNKSKEKLLFHDDKQNDEELIVVEKVKKSSNNQINQQGTIKDDNFNIDFLKQIMQKSLKLQNQQPQQKQQQDNSHQYLNNQNNKQILNFNQNQIQLSQESNNQQKSLSPSGKQQLMGVNNNNYVNINNQESGNNKKNCNQAVTISNQASNLQKGSQQSITQLQQQAGNILSQKSNQKVLYDSTKGNINLNNYLSSSGNSNNKQGQTNVGAPPSSSNKKNSSQPIYKFDNLIELKNIQNIYQEVQKRAAAALFQKGRNTVNAGVAFDDNKMNSSKSNYQSSKPPLTDRGSQHENSLLGKKKRTSNYNPQALSKESSPNKDGSSTTNSSRLHNNFKTFHDFIKLELQRKSSQGRSQKQEKSFGNTCQTAQNSNGGGGSQTSRNNSQKQLSQPHQSQNQQSTLTMQQQLVQHHTKNQSSSQLAKQQYGGASTSREGSMKKCCSPSQGGQNSNYNRTQILKNEKKNTKRLKLDQESSENYNFNSSANSSVQHKLQESQIGKMQLQSQQQHPKKIELNLIDPQQMSGDQNLLFIQGSGQITSQSTMRSNNANNNLTSKGGLNINNNMNFNSTGLKSNNGFVSARNSSSQQPGTSSHNRNSSNQVTQKPIKMGNNQNVNSSNGSNSGGIANNYKLELEFNNNNNNLLNTHQMNRIASSRSAHQQQQFISLQNSANVSLVNKDQHNFKMNTGALTERNEQSNLRQSNSSQNVPIKKIEFAQQDKHNGSPLHDLNTLSRQQSQNPLASQQLLQQQQQQQQVGPQQPHHKYTKSETKNQLSKRTRYQMQNYVTNEENLGSQSVNNSNQQTNQHLKIEGEAPKSSILKQNLNKLDAQSPSYSLSERDKNKQIFTYNNNNIVNIFFNSSPTKKFSTDKQIQQQQLNQQQAPVNIKCQGNQQTLSQEKYGGKKNEQINNNFHDLH